MKTLPVESTGPKLRTLLPTIAEEEAVFLTVEGEVRFVVLPYEGDQEMLAMRGNQRLMEFLDRCGERAKTGPRKSLADLRPKAMEKRPSRASGRARANGKSNRTSKKKT